MRCLFAYEVCLSGISPGIVARGIFLSEIFTCAGYVGDEYLRDRATQHRPYCFADSKRRLRRVGSSKAMDPQRILCRSGWRKNKTYKTYRPIKLIRGRRLAEREITAVACRAKKYPRNQSEESSELPTAHPGESRGGARPPLAAGSAPAATQLFLPSFFSL